MRPLSEIVFSSKCVRAGLAVAAVAALFILQAYSLSVSRPEVELFQLKSLEPKRQNQPKRESKKPAETELKAVYGAASEALPVDIPAHSASDFSIPEYSLSSSQGKIDEFSFAAFSAPSGEDMDVEFFDIDMLDKVPKRLDNVRVEYPRQMLKRGVEGEVDLLVVIDTSGSIVVEKVIKATNKFFRDSAVEAASRFVYEPPTKNGKIVKARFVLPIPFRIVR